MLHIVRRRNKKCSKTATKQRCFGPEQYQLPVLVLSLYSSEALYRNLHLHYEPEKTCHPVFYYSSAISLVIVMFCVLMETGINTV